MDPTEPNQVNGGYMELLLLSNSRSPGQPMFAHAAEALVEFVAGRRITFLPMRWPITPNMCRPWPRRWPATTLR